MNNELLKYVLHLRKIAVIVYFFIMRVLQKIYKIYRDAYNNREYHTCLTNEFN